MKLVQQALSHPPVESQLDMAKVDGEVDHGSI
eukprot:SAG31_NODE_4654_length_3067_cov_2.007075_5_plen_32_part_00